MCAADDVSIFLAHTSLQAGDTNPKLQELLYVTPNHERQIGDGHVRQCRDFSKLDEWAMEHSACYTFEKLEPPFFVDQSYANCPKDSPYYQGMVEALGLPEDWEPPHTPKGPAFPV
jgi:hypothetical protein